MVTSMLLEDDAHRLIVMKQLDIRDKYKIKVNLTEIARAAIIEGIDRVEKNLGLEEINKRIDEFNKK